jgi:hypothetical protein
MGRSKKTRTKFTDRPGGRPGGRSGNARANVAFEAARILAVEGQNNYQAAKLKAAERLGLGDKRALPANSEVKDALRSYLELYGGAGHHENLERLRRVALEVMDELSEFQPRVVGGVLDGTATAHSHVGMHVFCDSPDDLVIHCLDRGIRFGQDERQIRWHDGSHVRMPVLLLERGGATVELMVFDRNGLRQAPPSPIDGRPQARGDRGMLAGLVNLAGRPERTAVPAAHGTPDGVDRSW